ncbi:MAG: SGNH/GDSL hydrolase family protein [Reyranella sp.]
MSGRASGWASSLIAGLALTVASVVLCLLAGEAISRLVDPAASLWRWPFRLADAAQPAPGTTQFAYDATLGWAPVAGSAGTMLGKPLSFTAQGTRAQNREGPPATGTLIVAFGDSMTEGFAVGDDETWPAALERLTGRPVLNAGVRGYGLDQMVLRAERLVPDLKPSTIVLAFIADDISRTALSVRDFRGKPYFMPDGDGLALRNVPVPEAGFPPAMAWLRKLLGHSHLFDRIVTRLGLRPYWTGREIGTGADPFAVSCRLMDRFAILARREGARALVVALPEQGVFFDEKAAAGQREALTRVLGCAARAGLATLDTTPAFRRENVGRDIDAWYTMMHFTGRGAALAAREIAAGLGKSAE